MKKDIYVVGAILIRDGKVLCAQRGGEKTLPYLWEFPGGKIEEGETPQQALKRELIEELEIEVEVEDAVFDRVTYEYDFGIVHLSTIISYLRKGEPKLTEHVAIQWLKPEDIKRLAWAPADVPTVDKISRMNLE